MKLITITTQSENYEQYHMAFWNFLGIYEYGEGKHTRKHNAVASIVGTKQALTINIVAKFGNNGEQLAKLIENNIKLHGVSYSMQVADMFDFINY